jgi:general secretion pathway protein D
VTPRITADGRVTLVIDAKVEDVLSTTNDPSFLNLSSRNVTTTVTVEEGQTLLLGGLLQSQLNVTRNRIPSSAASR